MEDALSLEEAVRLPADVAYRRAFRLDLSETEGIGDAQVSVWPTTVDEQNRSSPALTLPDGLVVSIDRRYHGAEVHLDWDQARALSEELLRLLAEHEAGA